jgi:hypothetical protein
MQPAVRNRHRALIATVLRWHDALVLVFLAIVIAHWAEHLVQAGQVWLLGWNRPDAGGVLGVVWPWLVTSEWMHYGYAVVMFAGLVLLCHGFTGRARAWWNAALYIQFWHHIEHLLLLVQASTGSYLLGAGQPTSIAQLIVPRVELHLLYNAIVTLPMVVAMVLHRCDRRQRARADHLGAPVG